MSRIIMSLILLMTLGFGGCKTPELIEEDGGVTKNTTNPNAPKVIESVEIVSFECEFSLIAIPDEDSKLSGRVYTLSAKKGKRERYRQN